MPKFKEKDTKPKRENSNTVDNIIESAEDKIHESEIHKTDNFNEKVSVMDALDISEKDFLAAREDVVKKVLSQQPDDEILYDLAELLKVFGDSTRIKILYSLFETELCVYDIARLLNLSQSSVSHQLRILKTSKLVKFRRDGKSVFYSLDDEHVRSIISMGMEHVEE